MAINRQTPVQTVESANTGDSYNCATRALIDYNTNTETVTIPFDYFRAIHDRGLPDKYIRYEEKLNTLKRMIAMREAEDRDYFDLNEIRMVIGDE